MRAATLCLFAAVSVLALSSADSAQAAKFRVLHVFLDGSDGATSNAPLITDSKGNLFGTALQGGATNNGVIFEVAVDGAESILYNFAGGTDGSKPEAGLLEDAAGNFYGTTYLGGPTNQGVAFKLAADGAETVLHTFAGGSDGASPQAGLIADKAGNLYGTASQGGSNGCFGDGCGTLFKIAPDGTFTVLHTFEGASDGSYPQGTLLADNKGNLYGTAAGGGAHGDGTVFRLSPDGKLKVLYAFAGGSDGAGPPAGLIRDKAGNFYGTTRNGGGSGCDNYGCGTVFRLAPDGHETVLYAFTGGSDGGEPYGGVIVDGAGSLCGTTITGGIDNDFGVVFKLSTKGKETVLHALDGANDGAWPEAGVIIGGGGKLYGTAYAEGPDEWGTVFSIPK
jgi:uncharacterized repeat protein (TIGR03803 family)